jgi:hypothetical protein
MFTSQPVPTCRIHAVSLPGGQTPGAANRLVNSSVRNTSAICLLIALVFVAGCGDQQRYELIDQRARHTYLVYVPKQHAADLSAYKQAIREIAGDPRDVCLVMFWNERSRVWRPDQAEMTMQQEAARVAGYSRDPSSGLNNFYWLRNGDRVDVGPIE